MEEQGKGRIRERGRVERGIYANQRRNVIKRVGRKREGKGN